jgi:hypothetical protein
MDQQQLTRRPFHRFRYRVIGGSGIHIASRPFFGEPGLGRNRLPRSTIRCTRQWSGWHACCSRTTRCPTTSTLKYSIRHCPTRPVVTKNAANLEAAAAALDRQSGDSWQALDEAAQIEAMRSIEAEPSSWRYKTRCASGSTTARRSGNTSVSGPIQRLRRLPASGCR